MGEITVKVYDMVFTKTVNDKYAYKVFNELLPKQQDEQAPERIYARPV